ncbi:hypothetical protein [Streptomyces sp. NPDC001828]|uniref:hypothetical protein n=1 Tax=Streptomyces sp. NPDC001828 TaxID=3364615 RepID=UPI0036A4140C
MSPASGAVQIFLDRDFKGASATLDEGSYDVNHLQAGAVGNDAISSLKVADGYEVTVYKDAGLKGDSKTFTADAAALGEFSDTISSLKVTKKGVVAPAPRSSVPRIQFRYPDGALVPQDIIAPLG